MVESIVQSRLEAETKQINVFIDGMDMTVRNIVGRDKWYDDDCWIQLVSKIQKAFKDKKILK